MNRIAGLSGKDLTNAPKQDLRTWLGQLDAADELQVIKGANREEEIGGIVDVHQRQTGNRAVLFDDVPGYPERLSGGRQHPHLGQAHQAELGLAPDASDMALVNYRRKYMKEGKTIPPVTVPTARAAETSPRRRREPAFNSGAEMARARRRLLYRHRLHGDHAASRHRLDQLRRSTGCRCMTATSPP
jgi:hypothetical protein